MLGLVAFERQGRGRDVLVGAALAVGLYALSVREFAILAPLAVVGGYGVANRRDGRSVVHAIVALAGLVLAGFVLYRWRRSFAGDTSHFFGSNFSFRMSRT